MLCCMYVSSIGRRMNNLRVIGKIVYLQSLIHFLSVSSTITTVFEKKINKREFSFHYFWLYELNNRPEII